MKKTLYVTDLDGTLLKDDKSISDTSVAIMNHLIEAGVLVTYATARTINSASRITRDIHFQLPVITRNGTVIADPKTRKEVEIKVFEQEELQAIRQRIKEYDIPGFITTYVDGKEKKLYLKEKMNTGFLHYLTTHVHDGRLDAVQTENELYNGEVCYFTFIADQEELEPMYRKINESDQWNCVFQKDKYRPEYWLEICPKEATKAKAIQKLQKQYSCERLVVFGDSLNDISMFQAADEAYAVMNADERLKEIAAGVIGDNNSDSVAQWIYNIFKSK